MNETVLLLMLGGAALLLVAFAGLLLHVSGRQSQFRARVRLAQAGVGEGVADGAPAPPAGRGLLSTRTLLEFEQTLMSAGFRGGNGLGLFVGSKLLLVCGLPLLAFPLVASMPLPGALRTALIFGSGVVGLLAPDIFVRWRRKRHLRQLEKGLPDALDMLVICAEAGLSLEPAINRVGQEIAYANRAVSEELAQTAGELRITSDTRLALLNLGKRTGLESLKRLGAVLTQSIQYGTPLTRALRTLAAEMREEMLVRFEARAARLPVLLTVPMIVFILPCLFMIVGGPAMLQVLRAFHH